MAAFRSQSTQVGVGSNPTSDKDHFLGAALSGSSSFLGPPACETRALSKGHAERDIKGQKATADPDVIRTRSLLIWSQTRYHCATESLQVLDRASQATLL